MLNIVGKFLGLGQGEEGNLPEPNSSANCDVSAESKEYSGKVTSLHGNYGLIDGEVYFNLNVVADGYMPKVGANVNVVARRKHGMGGWRAEQVSIQDNSEDWDDTTDQAADVDLSEQRGTEADEKKDDFIIGMITGISCDQGIINNSIQFHLPDVVGYIPNKGDWVTAKVLEALSDAACYNAPVATEIKPLREKEFEGSVNTVNQGFGYIDQEIYFTFSACVENYIPRRGDAVCGKAIESVRGRSTWRAISVDLLRGKKTNLDSFNCNQETLNRTRLKSITELLEDKNGIEIVKTIDFGRIELGKTRTIQIVIRNTGEKTNSVQNCVIHSSGKNSQFEVKDFNLGKESNENKTPNVIHLGPGKSTAVDLYCHARYLGTDKVLIVIEFDGFKIGRHAQATVFEPSQYRLDPTNPYQRKKSYGKYKEAQQRDKDSWVVPGQKPERVRPNLKLPNRLGQYPVPADLRDCVLDKRDIVTVAPYLGEELCMENYSERLSALLHLEEIQEEIEIREFDMERVCMRTFGEFLALRVPGLAEGRPSVLIGDRVILSDPGSAEYGPSYEGFIHEVMSEEVLLKFHHDFHSSYTGEDYNVQFTFNRTTLRRAHQAAQFATKLGKQVIFPTSLYPRMPQTRVIKGSKPPPRAVVSRAQNVAGVRKCPLGARHIDHVGEHKFFNAKLNSRQRSAVLRILNGQCRPMPYILFGPPGTGKTVTLVEAILQIFHHMPSSRIIACTPSNSAADLLVERLHGSGLLQKSDMVRLNAFQRSQENIPNVIQPYCSDGEDLEVVSRFRVLVCTCSSSGMMYSLAMRPGHFTHAFVDESGQSTEPECLIPIGLAASGGGQVVLAGDPKQLGPVLRSSQAKDYGLELSFLERIMDLPLYNRDENKFADHGCYDPLLVTKLVENYRSHPALVNLSSGLFYNGELQVSADQAMINCLSQWDQLPCQGFPLIFHGVRGDDMREGNSPSWFNPQEVFQVNAYLKLLIENSLHPLEYDEIGVITPYRKQVEKIRFMIDKFGMEKVKVGSVEEFQGQERLVMIISTVRSNEELVGIDLRHNLGFLCNPKRFNVSITRAQALMVIIGNPFILSQDANWKALLRYALENHAYVGCEPPDLSEHDPVITPQDSPSPADTKPCQEQCLHSSQVSEDSFQLTRHDLSAVTELSEDSLTDRSGTAGDKSAPSSQVSSAAVNTPGVISVISDQSAKLIGTSVILQTVSETPVGGTINIEATGNQHSELNNNNHLNGRNETDADGMTSEGWDTEEEEEVSLSASYYSDDLESPEQMNTADSTNNMEKDDEFSKSQTVSFQSKSAHSQTADLQDTKDIDTEAVTKAIAGVLIANVSDGAMDVPYQLDQLDNLVIHQDLEEVKDNRTVTCNMESLKITMPISNANCVTPTKNDVARSLENLECNNSIGEEDTSSWIDEDGEDDEDSEGFLKEGEVKEVVSEAEIDQDDQGGDDDEMKRGEDSNCDHDDSYDTTSSSCTDSETECVGEGEQEDHTSNPILLKNSNPSFPHRGWYCGSEWKIQPTDSMLAKLAKSRDNYEIYRQCRQHEKRRNHNSGATNSSSKKTGISNNGAPVSDKRYQETKNTYINQGACQGHNGRSENPSPGTPRPTQSSSQQRAGSQTPSSVPQQENPRSNQLEVKIIRQLEYYFGDLNLIKDDFLQEQISANPEGWVPFKVLITFNRLKALTMDFNVIVTAINKSTSGLLQTQVHADGLSVRRNPDFPQITNHDVWKRQLATRSIALSGVPFRERLDVIQSSCEHYGEVEHVEKDIWWNENPLGANNNRNITLVVFYNEESVTKASRYVTVFRRRWKISTLGSFVRECVDYFYDKKVRNLAKEHLVPVGKRNEVSSSSIITNTEMLPTLLPVKSIDNESSIKHGLNDAMESDCPQPSGSLAADYKQQRTNSDPNTHGADVNAYLGISKGMAVPEPVEDTDWTCLPKTYKQSQSPIHVASQYSPPQPIEKDRQYKQNLWMTAQQKPHTLKLIVSEPGEVTPGQTSQNPRRNMPLGRGAVIISHMKQTGWSPSQASIYDRCLSKSSQSCFGDEDYGEEMSMGQTSLSTPSYSSFIHTDESLGVSALSSSVFSQESGEDQPAHKLNPDEGLQLGAGEDQICLNDNPNGDAHHHSSQDSMNTSQQSDKNVDISFQGFEAQSLLGHSTPSYYPQEDFVWGSSQEGSGQDDSYRKFMSLEQLDDDVIVESSEEEVMDEVNDNRN